MSLNQKRKPTRNHRTLALGTTAWLALMSVPALAQSAPASASEAQQEPQVAQPDDAGGLEDIVVTARKREESLQETPVSVAAFGADALEERAVTSIVDVGKFTPNVSFEPAAFGSGASFNMVTFIRGVGQADFTLVIDPGVGLYVDGVYVARSVGALLDTMDPESVQVLRGPQGTLFGKNTIGGAIVINSRGPSSDVEASVEATTGSYDRADFRGMLNVPLNDMIKVRGTVAYQSRDGYVKRLVDGGRMGNRNSLAGRLQVLIEPSNSFSIMLSGDYTRSREQALPPILLAVNESTDPSLNLYTQFHNWVAAPIAAGLPPFSICGQPGVPSPTNDARCYNSQWITGDKHTTWASGPNRSDLDLWGASATMDLNLGEADLKSITAYRKLSSQFSLDADASPLTIELSENDYSQEQFSQEFQLTGKAFDARLDYLFGAFYMKEKGEDRNSLAFSVADIASFGAVDNDSLAAFSQLTYAITPKFRVTLGARYTYEKKRYTPDQVILNDKTGGSLLALSRLLLPDPVINPDGNRILPMIEGVTTAKEFTPAATIDYRFSPEVFGYVSYSKGFKSGGFTQRVFPPLAEVPSFGPEFVTSYEAGLKTELFDRRLRVNAAVFYADYDGIQINVFANTIAPTTRNAGKARIKGVELEAEAQLGQWLRFNGGLGYIDAKYVEVSPLATDVTVNSKLAYVPKWTATGGVSVGSFDLPIGTLSFRADASYKSSQFLSADNSPILRQKAGTLVGVSASLEDPAGHWTVSVGGTNLTNRKYLVSGVNQINTAGLVQGTYSRGSEWFLRLRYKL